MSRYKYSSPASKLKRGILIFLTVLLIALLAAYCIFAYRRTGTVYPTRELFDGLPTIRFVDVGQGDCMLVTYQGDSVLIDAGTTTGGMTAAEYVFAYAPVIDYFVISHPHEDHMGGAEYILEKSKVKNLVLSADVVSEEFYTATLELAENRGTNIIYVTEPCELSVGEINITILDTFGLDSDEMNNKSLITRIDVEKTSVLVVGDAEAAAEKYAIAHNSPALLDCDILKLGHHGSSTSTTEEFLAVVSPKICVASAGRNNSYGHPSGKVVERVKEYGAELFRTDTDGHIVLRGEK